MWKVLIQMLSIKEMQEEQCIWAHKNFPNNNRIHQLLGIVEEVGELSHAHLKMDQGIRGNNTEHYNAKIDALGDIFVYMMGYANKNDIDLEDAIVKTWNKVKQRDWNKDKLGGGEAGGT